ncbi:MAG: hypothetical protein CMO01_28995 [Thalassobius sp.]|nr:hypothetical protein [Thalassovita sp.]
MIQRLQSIFLFLASLAMFLVIFLPIWNKTLPETTEEYAVLTALDLTISKGGETVDKIQTFYIAILAFVASALAMGSLFSYKNRLLQMKINLGNTLVMAAVLILSTYFLFQGEKMFSPEVEGQWRLGFFLTPFAMICNSIANRFIRKDEKLVRSADRLR